MIGDQIFLGDENFLRRSDLRSNRRKSIIIQAVVNEGEVTNKLVSLIIRWHTSEKNKETEILQNNVVPKT